MNILINATDNGTWAGGLYYKKNILFSLLQNESIRKKCKFYVLTEKENCRYFKDFDISDGNVKIIGIKYRKHFERKLKLLFFSKKYRCKYIFPSFSEYFEIFGIKVIHWIPDFQHNRLPQFFKKEECNDRNLIFKNVSKNKNPLVLSSNDSLKDFKEFYLKDRRNVYVIPFVSYIEKEIQKVSKEREKEILSKYELSGKYYACVMNQFWKHKNHIVILRALEKLFCKLPDSNFYCVFTGLISDYRNPEYIEELKLLFNDVNIKKHIKVLGFIERDEQLAIMKNAEYVIQPSLFEGWGTVVEDAKVLDKTILLSDIPVHREQKNEKCILFNPYDADMLAKLIEKENEITHHSSIEAGIADMYKRAKKYSKEFQKLLNC